jgi:hypothetical protein
MLKKCVGTVVLAMTMVAVVAGVTAATCPCAWAQGASTPKRADNAENGEEKTSGAYRVDFTISELEDGKKINARQYSMNFKSPEANEMKIGTRVPVEVKAGEVQYLDVGTSIWARVKDQADGGAALGNNIMLNVKAELSNFAIPDQQNQTMRPAIRQMKIEASTIAVVGKPMIVGSADDPNSKRQFQLEVIVTKLR